MISKIRESQREEGFTLIELLVVVIIIGILAAIAIPVFLNQRQKAWKSAVKSDLRNAASFQEAYFTENASYSGDAAGLAAEGFRQSSDITFDAGTDGTFWYTTTVSNRYCMEAYHNADAANTYFSFDSNVGEPVGATALGACN